MDSVAPKHLIMCCVDFLKSWASVFICQKFCQLFEHDCNDNDYDDDVIDGDEGKAIMTKTTYWKTGNIFNHNISYISELQRTSLKIAYSVQPMLSAR